MSELSTETLDQGNMGGYSQDMPNSTGVLVLGICSIVFAVCYGVVGLICGIIALVLASKPLKEYKLDPGKFTQSSYKNMNAGRICAIIGLSISAVFFAVILIYIVFMGAVIGGLGGMM